MDANKGVGKRLVLRAGPSGEIRYIKVLIPSSRNQVTVHRTVTFYFSNLPTKERTRKSKSSFWFFGPSGEIRTPGILNPNRVINFFLTIFSPFRGIYSERSCFPELSAPLFPGVRILSMVKNVVKSKHSPKGSTFRGVFSRSEVW